MFALFLKFQKLCIFSRVIFFLQHNTLHSDIKLKLNISKLKQLFSENLYLLHSRYTSTFYSMENNDIEDQHEDHVEIDIEKSEEKIVVEKVPRPPCTGVLKPNPIYQKLMVENLTVIRGPILKLYYWESFDITG